MGVCRPVLQIRFQTRPVESIPVFTPGLQVEIVASFLRFKFRVIGRFMTRGHNIFTVCVEGMHCSWIKLYPNLDWAFTSSTSFFSLEGVKQVKTSSAHDNSQREGRETRRRDRLFSPPPIVLPFSRGWRRGGALYTGVRVFARSYGRNDNNKVPLFPTGKIRVYSRSKI